MNSHLLMAVVSRMIALVGEIHMPRCSAAVRRWHRGAFAPRLRRLSVFAAFN